MKWEDRQAGRKEGEMPLPSMPLRGTFWRVFVDRPTIVYFLVHSDGEHHFRDAVSLTEVSRVFPHGLTQLRFCPVIPGVTELDIPAPGEGIIVLGRPGLFQSQFLEDRILATLNSPLQLHFLSNNPQERGYRTVCCRLTNHEYNVPDGHETLTDSHLEDFAQVYLGRAQVYESEEPLPCLILAGASTLGTWGASVFATSPYLLERHVGYSPRFQGVLSVALHQVDAWVAVPST